MPLLQGASFQTLRAWWWPSITAWLPDHFRTRLVPEQKRQTLRWLGVALGPETTRPGNDTDAILLLPKSQVLIRTLQLPASAAPRLRDVAQFEIDRQTPFSPDQVYFDAVLACPIRRGQGTITAKLIVVPKHMLDSAIETAAACTTRLVAVDVEGADGVPLQANLLPIPLRYRPPERWRRWNIALSAMCAIAALGLSISVLHARQRGIAKLEQQATAVLTQAGDVQRREVALSNLRRVSLPGGQAAPPSTLVLLSQLSSMLPLDSHFIHIELSDGVVTARGQAEDLSGVLTALRDSKLWADPELTGSRTLPDGHRQEFSLRLRLRNQQVKRSP